MGKPALAVTVTVTVATPQDGSTLLKPMEVGYTTGAEEGEMEVGTVTGTEEGNMEVGTVTGTEEGKTEVGNADEAWEVEIITVLGLVPAESANDVPTEGAILPVAQSGAEEKNTLLGAAKRLALAADAAGTVDVTVPLGNEEAMQLGTVVGSELGMVIMLPL